MFMHTVITMKHISLEIYIRKYLEGVWEKNILSLISIFKNGNNNPLKLIPLAMLKYVLRFSNWRPWLRWDIDYVIEHNCTSVHILAKILIWYYNKNNCVYNQIIYLPKEKKRILCFKFYPFRHKKPHTQTLMHTHCESHSWLTKPHHSSHNRFVTITLEKTAVIRRDKDSNTPLY